MGVRPLIPRKNLADLVDKAVARTNLQLGTGDSPTFAGLTLNGPANLNADILFGTNNAYDVGKTGARARNGWFGGTVVANDLSVVTTATVQRVEAVGANSGLRMMNRGTNSMGFEFYVPDSGTLRLYDYGTGTNVLDITNNGEVRALNGWAGFPSHSFRNDPDTGMFLLAANIAGISAGGKMVAQFDNGAGTTYPEAGTYLRAYNLILTDFLSSSGVALKLQGGASGIQCYSSVVPNGSRSLGVNGATWTEVWANNLVPSSNIYWGSVSDGAPRLWGGMFGGRYTLSPWDMSATYYTQQNGHQIIGNRFTSGYHYGGNSTGFSPFINVDSHLMLAAGIPIRFSGSSTDVYNSGAADLKLVRSGTKTLTLDDNAGGNATLKVVGSFLMQPSPAVAGYAAFYATNFGHPPVGLFPSGQNGNQTGIAWYNTAAAPAWQLMLDPTGSTEQKLELKRYGVATPLLSFPVAGTSMDVNGSITVSNGATFRGTYSGAASYVAVEPTAYAFHAISAGPTLKISDVSASNVYGMSVSNSGTFILGPSGYSLASLMMNPYEVFLTANNHVYLNTPSTQVGSTLYRRMRMCTSSGGRFQMLHTDSTSGTKFLDVQLNGSAVRFPLGIQSGGNADLDGAAGGATFTVAPTGITAINASSSVDNTAVLTLTRNGSYATPLIYSPSGSFVVTTDGANFIVGSNADTRWMSLAAAGVSFMGTGNFGDSLTTAGNLGVGQTAALVWTNRSRITAPSDGAFYLMNNAGNAWAAVNCGNLQVNGTTNLSGHVIGGNDGTSDLGTISPSVNRFRDLRLTRDAYIGGTARLGAMADTSANPDSWYFSTDAGKPVYQDSSGVVHALY